MDLDTAQSIVLFEAFSEEGLVMAAHGGDDPGYARLESLLAAINFLAEELAAADVLSRPLVSALFALATDVPQNLERSISPLADSRCSYQRQITELSIAITNLIESWDHWPDQEELATRRGDEAASDAAGPPLSEEELAGYRLGDITYAFEQPANEFFPVRVIRLGFNVLEVEALDPARCGQVGESFLAERLNRCFQPPALPPLARFGGYDERLVNAARCTGPELRLLPVFYATIWGDAIRQRHAADPTRWPLPTGLVYERWFKRV